MLFGIVVLAAVWIVVKVVGQAAVVVLCVQVGCSEQVLSYSSHPPTVSLHKPAGYYTVIIIVKFIGL